ncbi:MAG TPA: hypothetical protein VKH45_15155 [Candidatus Acidoferrum sp.]|nr:hypothetical protein [Candidatus Acidoferrum sp.]
MTSRKLVVGFLVFLFSMGASAQTAATKITVIGKLTRVMAIGGESTGWAVEFDTETNVQNKPMSSIEVKFSDPQQAEKYANKRVKITGIVTHRRGVETGDAPMLAITSIKALKPTS